MPTTPITDDMAQIAEAELSARSAPRDPCATVQHLKDWRSATISPNWRMERDADGNVEFRPQPLATLDTDNQQHLSIWRRLWNYLTGPCA